MCSASSLTPLRSRLRKTPGGLLHEYDDPKDNYACIITTCHAQHAYTRPSTAPFPPLWHASTADSAHRCQQKHGAAPHQWTGAAGTSGFRCDTNFLPAIFDTRMQSFGASNEHAQPLSPHDTPLCQTQSHTACKRMAPRNNTCSPSPPCHIAALPNNSQPHIANNARGATKPVAQVLTVCQVQQAPLDPDAVVAARGRLKLLEALAQELPRCVALCGGKGMRGQAISVSILLCANEHSGGGGGGGASGDISSCGNSSSSGGSSSGLRFLEQCRGGCSKARCMTTAGRLASTAAAMNGGGYTGSDTASAAASDAAAKQCAAPRHSTTAAAPPPPLLLPLPHCHPHQGSSFPPQPA